MEFLTEKEYISKMHFLVGYLETEAQFHIGWYAEGG